MSLSNFYIFCLAYSTVSISFGGFSTAFSVDVEVTGVYSVAVEVSVDSDSGNVDGFASAAAAAAPPLCDS